MVAAILGGRCTGQVVESGSQERAPGSAGTRSGSATAPTAPGSAAAEAAMRAANPQLYATATKYFPGETVSSPPKRICRLTRTQLDITTKAVLPAHHKTPAVTALPPDPLQTNYEYAENLGFSAANFTPYLKWVDQIVASVRAKPETVINCAAGGLAPACLQAEAKKLITKAFRGTASLAQLARYADFFAASVGQVGFPDATADLVHLTLTSPSYVFREEVLTDGASLMPAPQRLQSLTYTLADAPPDAVGLSAAAPGPAVQTPDAVRKTVDAILATPEARAKLRRFLIAWLEVKEPDEFTIATSAFPAFTPQVAAAAVADTGRFLDYELAKSPPRLADITQATQSFVSPALAPLYDIKTAPTNGPVDLDPARWLGIFTQPAVIASHSGPTTTRLVKRGVFFTRKVMCLALGAPPPGLDTSVPARTGVTERQQIEAGTRSPVCAGCHGVINPFGFMQENYDAIGRWRTTDAGQPIDASIAIDFLDEGTLSTSSPVEALKRLTSSLMFKQCFARQLFRFYVGREEAPGDDPVLRKMFFELAGSSTESILLLLQGLGTSPTLSQRAQPSQEVR